MQQGSASIAKLHLRIPTHMNSNTLCLRIFYVLYIVIVGGFTAAIYATRALTPIAVCLLPTDNALARQAGGFSFVEYHLNSPQQLFHTQITFEGYSETLLSTSPPFPTPNPDIDVAQTRPDIFWPAGALTDTESRRSPAPTVAVRYVRAFPSMVVRDLPDASLGSYYADTWTWRDFPGLFIAFATTALVAFLLYRNLKKSRRSYRR